MTDNRKKTGAQKTKKADPATETASQNIQANIIIFRDTMERRMAEKLLSGWHSMPGLTGGNLCGGNPYQYVRSLRSKAVLVNYIHDTGEQYGRYKITDPVSRALVANSLNRREVA